MVRLAVGIAVAACILTGCASTMSSPPTTDPMLSQAQQCVRGGGWWRQSLGICDMPGGGEVPRGK